MCWLSIVSNEKQRCLIEAQVSIFGGDERPIELPPTNHKRIVEHGQKCLRVTVTTSIVAMGDLERYQQRRPFAEQI
ncbi:hypothetical protein B0920_14695 [Massilia sp. KIM]|nr:hypothetical protein B0920_14695 [Massilia sp. KIM]